MGYSNVGHANSARLLTALALAGASARIIGDRAVSAAAAALAPTAEPEVRDPHRRLQAEAELKLRPQWRKPRRLSVCQIDGCGKPLANRSTRRDGSANDEQALGYCSKACRKKRPRGKAARR